MTQNAGGSATNSGINYQNRCAAYYLAMMLSNSTESDSIGIKPIDIVRVAFEANCPIDDFVVETTDTIFYFQAKRSSKAQNSYTARFLLIMFFGYRDRQKGFFWEHKSTAIDIDTKDFSRVPLTYGINKLASIVYTSNTIGYQDMRRHG